MKYSKTAVLYKRPIAVRKEFEVEESAMLGDVGQTGRGITLLFISCYILMRSVIS